MELGEVEAAGELSHSFELGTQLIDCLLAPVCELTFCEFSSYRADREFKGVECEMQLQLKSIVPERMSTPAKLFLWSNVLNGLGNGIFNVILQLYMLQLGFTASDLGTIFMMSSIAMFVFTIPAGILADRYGRGKVMMAGWIPLLVQMAIILTSSSLEMMSFAWLLNGIGNATSNVLTPIFSSLFEKEDLDKAFGLRGFINIVSMSAGSLMGFIPPMLVTTYGYSLRFSYWTMLLLGGITFMVQIPFLWLMFRDIHEEKRGNGFQFKLQSRNIVVKYSIINIIQNVSFSPFSSLLPYFVNKKFGVESDALGAIQFVSYFVQAGANILGPRISQRFGAVKTVSIALILASPFFALLAIAPSFFWVSIIFVIRLGIASVCNPLMPSLFFKLIHEEEKATANSISILASMGSNIFTPKLGAYLIEDVSIDAPALLAASMYPFYGATFYYFFKNEKVPDQIAGQAQTD